MSDDSQLLENQDFLNELEKQDKPSTAKNESPKVKIQEVKESKQSTSKLSQGQKFFLSILFFLLVLAFGFFIMLLTGTMVLP